VSGVRSATVILDAGRASVRWNSGAETNVSAVTSRPFQKAGYTAKEIQAGTSVCCEPRHASWQYQSFGLASPYHRCVDDWRMGFSASA